MRASLIPILFKSKKYTALTLSGNEITDASRPLGLAGDGRLNDSSFGIWPAATNLCTNGGFETNTTGWIFGGLGSLARSAVQAEFGSWSGRIIPLGQNDGAHIDPAVVAGTIYTQSVWVYRTTLADNWQVWAWGSSTRQTNASVTWVLGWNRAIVSFTAAVGETSNQILVINTSAVPTETVYVDGAQLETGSVATPYIETDGATAARSVARVQVPVAGLFTSTQGWVAARLRMGWADSSMPNAAPFVFSWGDDTGTTYIYCLIQGSQWQFRRRDGDAGFEGVAPAASFSAGDYQTIICAWTNAEVKASPNGAAFTSAASTMTPSLPTTFDIGRDLNGSYPLASDVLWFACGTGTLSDGDAAMIHAFGNNDMGLSAFPGNPSGFWSAANGFMEVA